MQLFSSRFITSIRVLAVSTSLLCFVSYSAVADTNEAINTELQKYYENKANVPAYRARVDQLSSPNREVQQQATEYLLALLSRLRADREAGTAPVDQTPFWGGSGSRSYADVLTSDVVKAANLAQVADSALSLGEWLLVNGEDDESLALAIKIVCANRTAESTGIIERTLADATNSPKVLSEFASELSKRKGKEAKSLIDPLANHHRAEVRNEVKKIYSSLGWAEPAFSEAEANKQLAAHILNYASPLLFEPLPNAKAFKKLTVTTTYRGIQGKTEAHTSSSDRYGWVLSTTDQEVTFIDVFAEEYTVRLEATETRKVTLSDYPLAEYARRLIEARANLQAPASGGKLQSFGDSDGLSLLSPRGLLTAQFTGTGLALSEVLVTLALIDEGKADLATKLVVPAFLAQPTDRAALNALKNSFGGIYHQELLDAFTQASSKYELAIKFADHLSKPVFGGYHYQARAIELAQQLRERKNDFVTLTLPTAKEWAQMKGTMSKPEQVSYLGQRVRLLHAVQWGQPGGVNFEEKNSLPPKSEFNKQNEGSLKINPYLELKLLVVETADIPLLLPYLEDRNYILAYGYWRDFHPGRSIYRVNGLIAAIINGIAEHPLVDPEKWNDGDKEKRNIYQAAVRKWCDENKGESRSSLALKEMRTTGERNAFLAKARMLAEHDNLEALQLMDARILDFDEYVVGDLGRILWESKRPERFTIAARWADLTKSSLGEKNCHWRDTDVGFGGLKGWAATTLLDGDAEQQRKALQIFKEILAMNNTELPYEVRVGLPFMVDSLLRSKEAEAKAVACKMVSGKDKYRDLRPVTQRLFVEGCDEALRQFLETLDDVKELAYSVKHVDGKEVRIPEGEPDYLIEALAADSRDAKPGQGWLPVGFTYSRAEPLETRIPKRVEEKNWLSKLHQRIKSGEKINLPVVLPKTSSKPRIDAP